MIKIVNTEYRNIQEQVAKNASDIAELQEEVANIDIEDSAEAIQNKQLGFAIILNPLTNINGKSLTAYGYLPETIAGYQTYIIYKTSAPSAPLSKEDASAYLLALSGLGYAPEYDFDHPKYHYFVVGDGTEYLKPQWDEANGLVLYRIASPYQSKLTAGDGIDITDNVISSTPSGGTQLYIHEFTWNSGLSGNFTYVMGAYVSANSTPVTNYSTLNNVIYGANRNGAKTMRIGYAAGGSIYGNFMFGFNSSLAFTMIMFSNDGSTSSATIGQGGNLTGSWTETVIEL